MPALLEDCLACAVDSLVAERPGGTVRTPAEFEETLALVRQNVVPRVLDVVAFVEPVLLRAREVEVALSGLTSPLVGALRADLTGQLQSLIHPGFVAETGYARLRHVERYLRAMTGPHDSVIGVEVEPALNRFLTALPQKFETATGNPRLNAVIVEADQATGRAADIERLSYSLDELKELADVGSIRSSV